VPGLTQDKNRHILAKFTLSQEFCNFVCKFFTMGRYIRNENMLSPEENSGLRNFRVAVVGCGGLGGHILEMLARLGIGQITAIDGDVFEASNLNRQLLSRPDNLGQSKALEAKKHLEKINPDVKVTALHICLDPDNAVEILRGHDLVCDALDNVSSRKTLQQAAEALSIPMVFAAIAGWYAQVTTIMPGDRTLDRLFPEGMEKGMETQLGNPSFTPALAASIQVAEALKVLLKREGILQNKLLTINLLDQTYEVIDL
jgi:molybdopterin-synthase adenylyltransferase